LIGKGSHADLSGNPFDVAANVTGGPHIPQDIGGAIKWFAGGGFKRVGMVLLGAALVIVAVVLMARSQGVSPV
jgi:hypothetical protein